MDRFIVNLFDNMIGLYVDLKSNMDRFIAQNIESISSEGGKFKIQYGQIYRVA